MKVWIWNAFASNNSGSYTILGSFPSEAEARRVAAELSEVLVAHSAWLEKHAQAPTATESPFEIFVRKNNLTWKPGLAANDDWPHYGGKDAPDAVAIGHQVAVHHDYTATLPRTFGELFYARGGRVDVELNHAHHPTVAVFALWIPWDKREEIDVNARVDALEAAFEADEGRFKPLLREGVAALIQRPQGDFGEEDLTVGAVFDDLAAGFAAVDGLARENGFVLRVKVLEAFSEDDPLGFLRRPQPTFPG
jgi:hypothetical protein